MKKVLTIAGSDPFGGAGMQADLKTMTAHAVYGMTAITLVSSQNTLGFYESQPVSSDMVKKQIDAIFSDDIPDATKTGMLQTVETIKAVASKLREYKPKNLVIDPVMMSFRTIKLIDDNAIETLIDELIPLADVITPNWGETEIISNMKINNEEDMIKAAKIIFEKYNCAVYTKTTLQGNNANDLLYTKDGYYWIEGEKLKNTNVRGTGCTLSSALASNLAKGMDLLSASKAAKRYVTNALKNDPKIGKGEKGPINHSYKIEGNY
ncbi:bifunctional hydroxymethylpyrimidine kinase/phosphomethylpyrimidine kinase [Helcococcus kunzii]|uniref:bifunctional hydroxymethylpyrimidine kinase/phosphomethylpyrimidine kinase n=1 Tax=Helcococcus kunzii TaxID=40091 RepID=UPI0024ADD212|nr:bifunctional hydroxymethylpyrimidine kinase/phosphomethylpyrimidine kinase [Helcococcus kunzii]